MSHHPSALFIVKHREGYGNQTNYPKELKSGLYNSAKFIAQMLETLGVSAHVVDVIDNNGIEKEVVKYNPTHVFIEALWVVPEKIQLLAEKYHRIKWVIRVHSNSPFLANEGMAITWLKAYDNIRIDNVVIAPNDIPMYEDLQAVLAKHSRIAYLPNYYVINPATSTKLTHHIHDVHVSSFGSIRPLKNQLTQAIAAIKFANEIGKHLVFHINATRIEQDGNNALKNILALFEGSRHKLVLHDWLLHDEFLMLISSMDINLQVSLTETFNIVTADSVNEHVPVVVSKEIGWVDCAYHADPNDASDIAAKMLTIWNGDKTKIARKNWLGLHQHNSQAQIKWLDFMMS
jgi:hypothetical protein